jgi:predicted TIM-barrel fold metal-dependent hydrolase
MIIDGHQHVLTHREYQVQYNKQCGVEKVLLFPTTVHPETAPDTGSFVNEMNKLQKILRGEINPSDARIAAISEMVAAIEQAPDLYTGFAPCPAAMDYTATANWIEQYIIKNKFCGIGELTFGSNNVLSLENIFRYLYDKNLSLPLWIHTFDPLTLNDIQTIIDLAYRYPSVNVILGHGGGRNWIETIGLAKKTKNVYVDISASYNVFSIKYSAHELPDQCIFGSDLPYGDPLTDIFRIEHLIKDRSIRENILGNTIRHLLNL